ncbi:MAG: rhomboid family intramembrane serine protease [Verrucomicrobiota bacterium]
MAELRFSAAKMFSRARFSDVLAVGRYRFDCVILIIGLNVAVFLLQQWMIWKTGFEGEAYLQLHERFALTEEGLRSGNWWQLVSYLFLHGGAEGPWMRFLHLGLNMLLIFLAGRPVLWAIGPWHFLGLYLLAGATGGVAQLYFSKTAEVPITLVGASAAAFGLMLAYTTLFPLERLHLRPFGRVRAEVLGRATWMACLILAFVDHFTQGQHIPFVSRIAHVAHWGGAMVGLLYVRVFSLQPKPFDLDALHRERETNDRRLDLPSSES